MQAKMQQLRARPASCGHTGPLLPRTAKCVAIRQQLPTRRLVAAAVPPKDDSTQPQTSQQDGPDAEDINSRILSGEFTDSGSTKEKLTRPIRKALAQDPVGIGRCCCCGLGGHRNGFACISSSRGSVTAATAIAHYTQLGGWWVTAVEGFPKH